MTFIRNRKHPVVLAAMMLPLAAGATETEQKDLPEVKVVGKAQNPFKADKAASTKYTEPLLDTAQSLSVIKKELIDEQGGMTLTDALRNTPGVGAFFLGENGSTSTGDAINMRGFDASSSIFVDGVRDIGSISRDMFNISQVDVLKGPAGTDNGRSSPTGSVNLVSKQAELVDFAGGSLSIGSARQRRVTADLNQSLDAAQGMAFRLNAMALDGGNPARDLVRNQRWAVAPSFAFGLGSPTRVFVNFLHVKQDNVPDGGVPTVGLPGYTSPDPARPFISHAAAVDPHGFYGSNLDYDQVRADMFTVRVEHDFSPALKLQNTSRYGKTQQNYLLTSWTASAANFLTPVPGDPATWTVARTNRTVKDQSNEIATSQTSLTAQLGQHTLLGGVELTSEKQSNLGYAGTGTLPPANLYHPDPYAPVTGLKLVPNGVFGDGATRTLSAYLFDTFKLGEDWIFNGGLRLDHYSTTYDGAALSTATSNPTLPVGTLVPTSLALSDTLVNGKISALYKPGKDSSVYALAATSKQAPGGANFALSANANSAANPKYDPQETTTMEVGARFDLLKQKLSLTGALYRTEITNEVEQDPVDLQYYQTGKKRVQGVEIGATGELTRNWLISAGYTRMDSKVVAGKAITANGSSALSYTPKQAFTAWTSYTLPAGLKIGGGARFVDELLRGTDGAIGTPARTASYWVIDGMASYAFNKHIDLQLNLYNLLDQQYVSAINKSGYRYTPGTPRSGSVTLRFNY